MKAYGFGWILALQFFSRIPIHIEVPMTQKHIERSVRLFPLFGLMLGLLYAGVGYLLLEWTTFSSLAVTFILFVLFIGVTGGIHLDGWMDMSDGYFSHREAKRRLEIMEDPRVGAFGVISAIILLGARFLFLYEIISMVKMTDVLFFLLFIPFCSRMLMGLVLVKVPVAKKTGLGHLFQSSCKSSTLPFYIIYFLVPIMAALFWDYRAAILVVSLMLLTILLFWFIRRKVMKHFGGITGDVLGASVEGGEVSLWMVVWLLAYFVMG